MIVLTDDLSWNLVRFMPEVQRMQREGMTFTHYFVTNSLCCPSRAGFLTGEYPHDSHVVRNTPPDGGYQAFAKGQHRTFATQLQRAGYRTALLGKYLNGYKARRDPPAAGWSYWFANGVAYREYGYRMLESTAARPALRPARPALREFGHAPGDYLVDVMARRGTEFIRRARKPFLAMFSTFTPHAPAIPAARDKHAYPNLPLPHPGSYDVANENAPTWLAAQRPLTPRQRRYELRLWRKRVRSVLAIDDLIRTVRATLAAEGLARDTYLIFTSDNGFHLGQHQLISGKRTAFDEDIRVPLIVVGPGIPPGTRSSAIAANIDVAPTLSELAGLRPRRSTDGRSLVPFLRGSHPRHWRRRLLIEYEAPLAHSPFPDADATDWHIRHPPDYLALRARNWVYVRYGTGEREFYDRRRDPSELDNVYGRLLPRRRARLDSELDRLAACHAALCRRD